MQQSEPALARLALQSSGMHEPTLEANQVVPSDGDISQASMTGVIWLLTSLSPLSTHGLSVCATVMGGFCA